jgi:peptidyl-tRNA hydrolase ICT1
VDWREKRKPPPTMAAGSVARFSGVIPIKRLVIDSCRASGPGGQHVNKKNTKVSVSFHVESADWLPDETRRKLIELNKANITKSGILTVRSDKTRSQTLNVADCLDKLRAYISEAEQPPEPELLPETIELRRMRLERAAAERLKMKRIRSDMIQSRRSSKEL